MMARQYLYLCWFFYFVAFLVSHIRVLRRRPPGAVERRVLKAPVSDFGMALEFVGITIAFSIRRPASAVPFAVALCSALLATGSVVLTWLALRHLGRQWRLRAVVTDDHQLVTTGPYTLLRHPIYASLLGMLLATALLLTQWVAAVAATAVFVAGTEIRVHAEDRLLTRHFPDSFPAYRARVRAYIPLLR
jgi:protein-S-isoprenylcysteine O-methyltransferase Ste14